MSSNAPVWAVVPAAGSGRRMAAEVPKQYLRFQHKTILEHTLDRLLSYDGVDGLVLLRVVVAGRLWRQRRRDLNITAATITHCGWNSTRALTCLIDTTLTQLFIDLLYSHARLAEQIARSCNVNIEA